MNPALRNILAIPVGAAVCLVLNAALLELLMSVNPAPEGFVQGDLSTYTLLQARHLMNAFIAHAVPSIIGGMLGALIATRHKMTFAIVVGGLHMIGGIAAAMLIPAPTWFIVLDLLVAYLPMAWLGGRMAQRIST